MNRLINANNWLALSLFVVLTVFIIMVMHPFPDTVQAAPTYPPKNGDPCQLNMRVSAPINLTASGQIVTGVANKYVYLCGFQIVNAAAQNIALVEGTGSVCGTSTVGMAGGNAAATGWNMAANQILQFTNEGFWAVNTQTAGDNVCLLLSGATQVSGFVQYVNQ